MSEEKLYAVKDDEGKYLLMVMDSGSCWEEDAGTATKSRNLALAWAKNNGGRVFTLVEAKTYLFSLNQRSSITVCKTAKKKR